MRAALPQIEAVVRLARDVFGADLIGAYPHGLTATGRLRPRLPGEHRGVLLRARAIYLEGGKEHWDDLETRIHPHAAHVVEGLRRHRPGLGAPEAR